MSIEKKPAKWIGKFLIFAVRTYIESRSKIIVDQDDTIDLKPPYIILANHVNNYDPLFVNSYVDDVISFVAGDSLFRNPILRNILSYTGAMPKAKFRNDTSTIRNIIKAKKHNRIIGLFPEGNRNWDGDTEPIIDSTAKLIRSLDIPVVIATIRGGYLSHPRWASSHRRGLISISYKKILNKGESKKKSPEELHQKLTDALAYSEMAWQATEQIPYRGKELAHYLERFLFVCPHCEKTGGLYSENDLFMCNHCGYRVRYTTLGYFEQVNHELLHQTPRDWNQWQLTFLSSILLNDKGQERFSIEDHVKLHVAIDNKPFQYVSSGNLSWDNPSGEIDFQADNEKRYNFKIEKMDGLNIHLHDNLDFVYEKKVYRLEFFQPRTSAYKWLKTLQHVAYSTDKEEVIS